MIHATPQRRPNVQPELQPTFISISADDIRLFRESQCAVATYGKCYVETKERARSRKPLSIIFYAVCFAVLRTTFGSS